MDPQPPVPEQRCLKYQYTQLADKPILAKWTPQYQSRDDLNTTTQKLADDPTLTYGTHRYQSREDLYTLHQSWQMTLLWPMDPPRYQSRDALNTTTQKLADDPILANGPLPSTRAEMP